MNPATGRPWYKDFPPFTIRDIVRAHRLLADALGIGRIGTLVGSSVGGFQAVEWAVAEPERIERLVLIATAAKASPWAIAIDETQRMAIEADTTFGQPRDDAGMKGLAAARAIGLLSYRGPEGYNLTQQDREGASRGAPGVHLPAVSGRKNFAAATTPTPITRSSTPSTRTTLDADGAGWSRRSAASRPGRWWSASPPTSSSPRGRCAPCTR